MSELILNSGNYQSKPEENLWDVLTHDTDQPGDHPTRDTGSMENGEDESFDTEILQAIEEFRLPDDSESIIRELHSRGFTPPQAALGIRRFGDRLPNSLGELKLIVRVFEENGIPFIRASLDLFDKPFKQV